MPFKTKNCIFIINENLSIKLKVGGSTLKVTLRPNSESWLRARNDNI